MIGLATLEIQTPLISMLVKRGIHLPTLYRSQFHPNLRLFGHYCLRMLYRLPTVSPSWTLESIRQAMEVHVVLPNQALHSSDFIPQAVNVLICSNLKIKPH